MEKAQTKTKLKVNIFKIAEIHFKIFYKRHTQLQKYTLNMGSTKNVKFQSKQ